MRGLVSIAAQPDDGARGWVGGWTENLGERRGPEQSQQTIQKERQFRRAPGSGSDCLTGP